MPLRRTPAVGLMMMLSIAQDHFCFLSYILYPGLPSTCSRRPATCPSAPGVRKCPIRSCGFLSGWSTSSRRVQPERRISFLLLHSSPPSFNPQIQPSSLVDILRIYARPPPPIFISAKWVLIYSSSSPVLTYLSRMSCQARKARAKEFRSIS
jgi:hypothetical protein